MLKALKRMFVTKEARAVLGLLDEADCRFNCPAFEMLKPQIEHAVLAQSDKYSAQIRDGRPPRVVVYLLIANTAAYNVESGQHHMYRGLLDNIMGEDLLKIYDADLPPLTGPVFRRVQLALG